MNFQNKGLTGSNDWQNSNHGNGGSVISSIFTGLVAIGVGAAAVLVLTDKKKVEKLKQFFFDTKEKLQEVKDEYKSQDPQEKQNGTFKNTTK